jgi:hypothetical protein
MRKRSFVASATLLAATLGVVNAGVSSADGRGFGRHPHHQAGCTSRSTPRPGSTIQGDLNVPPGATCVLNSVTITGHLTVGPDAIVHIKNTTVKGNATSTNSDTLDNQGGVVVEGNLTVTGLKHNNFACSATDGHPALDVAGNLTTTNGPVGGSFTFTPASPGFPCVRVGGNSTVSNNNYKINPATTEVAGNLIVSNNTYPGSADPTASMIVGRNVIGGNLIVTNNTRGAGGTADGLLVTLNTVTGIINCTGNNPAPFNLPPAAGGGPNVAALKLGQCAGL